MEEQIKKKKKKLKPVKAAPPTDAKRPTADLIREECDALKNLLLEKNAKYGDSALTPMRVFSKADSLEQILVRLDDKLSRIKTTGFEGADENTYVDFLGYLILYRVAKRKRAATIK